MGPLNGATVPAGATVRFSGESNLPLTFSVASSPALLSSPDIDSGLGSLGTGTSLYTFPSTKAAATPRTIYWAASFTFTPDDCEGPSTFTTPVYTLTVLPPLPTEAEVAAKKAGDTATINLTLNKTGRALLSAAHGRLSATLTILKTSPVPSTTQTQDVHLEQRKAARRPPHLSARSAHAPRRRSTVR